jgi:cytochrome c
MIRARLVHRLAKAATLAALAAASSANAAGPSGDPARGRVLYESRCHACHSLDHSRIGPAHRGVFGRRAGAVPGYEYSAAVKRSRIVWNAQSLDRWLTNPEALIPGQKMGYTVPDARDRADIIAFLMSSDARADDPESQRHPCAQSGNRPEDC